MVWFRVDDDFFSHEKVMALDHDEALACMGLWLWLGVWSAHRRTDGVIPRGAVGGWPDGARLADKLVAVGLLDATESGFLFHDWRDYQPTRAELEAERERWRLNKAAMRRRHRGVPGDSHGSPESVPSGHTRESPRDSTVSPWVPVPVPKESSNELSSEKFDVPEESPETDREDVEKLVTMLRDLIVENGAPRPAITKQWRESARLLLDRDGVDLAQAVDVLAWSQRDDFWRANILSFPKFRKQYGALLLKMQRQHPDDVDPWAGVPDWTHGNPDGR